jgi:hypothetical protein
MVAGRLPRRGLNENPNGTPPVAGLARLRVALPDWITAGVALHAWNDPQGFGLDGMAGFIALMLAEFMILLAFLLMTGVSEVEREERAAMGLWQIGIGALLVLMLGAACLFVGAWWPLAGGVWLVLSRLSLAFLDPLPRAQAERRARRVAGAALAAFVLAAMLWAVVTPPSLGFAAVPDWRPPIAGSGMLVEVPQLGVAWAFAYFLLSGLTKLVVRD